MTSFNKPQYRAVAPDADYLRVLQERVPFFDQSEDARLCNYTDYRREMAHRTYSLSEIRERNVEGFPICVTRDEAGELRATFTDNTHALVIGTTRSGKTTGFVLPFIHWNARKGNKPNMVISDPKKELVRQTGRLLEENGYRLIFLDFQDYATSDGWNPLTKIYRRYQEYLSVEGDVAPCPHGEDYVATFRGETFYSQQELDAAILAVKDALLADVDNMIVSLAGNISPVEKETDPYWDQMSSVLLQGFLWAMLEDSAPDTTRTRITEKTYSFDTLLRIFDSFDSVRSGVKDHGFFSDRDPLTSKAYQLVYASIINLSADSTRGCILSNFQSKMKKFRDIAVRRITRSNTFELDAPDDGRPTAIFISYKDEEALHYDVISLFLSDLYTALIRTARAQGDALKRPFYFLLDEFGNFPRFTNFENVISACGGRNIWFMMVVQSYAQLKRIYGPDTAEIIIDNLNMHLFFGSCNFDTKKDFSAECGLHTVISPLSAINGEGECVTRYEKEQVPLVPISRLSQLPEGEFIITQMRGDVIWSRSERSYTCPEYRSAGQCTYKPPVPPLADPEHTYVLKRASKR